jgi:TRAP-type C4-dicarboxylate transport system permease small subunit
MVRLRWNSIPTRHGIDAVTRPGSVMRRSVEGAARLVGALALLAMMVLTFLDVIARYVFAAPIYGVVEMIQFLLALMVFVGLALVSSRNEHIVVELFSRALERRWPRTYLAFVCSLSILGLGVMVWALWRATLRAAAHGTASVVLGIPLAWVIGTMATLAGIGLFLMVLSIKDASSKNGEAP